MMAIFSVLFASLTFLDIIQPCPVDNAFSLMSRKTTSRTTPPLPTAAPSTCGHSKYYYYEDQPGAGIVGGVTAKQNQFPWVVYLQISVSDGAGSASLSSCGGSIISANYILTAAHCIHFNGGVITSLSISFGDHNTSKEDFGEFSLPASTWIEHPLYSEVTQEYDFALLKISKPINFKSWAVQKICLPTSCDSDRDCTTAGSAAYVAGWGTTSLGGEASDVLLTAYVPVADWNICQVQYVGKLTDRMICAGYSSGGVDTCQGDSGGPFMSVENGYYKLCGVVSFGAGCGAKNYFGIYAKVCSVLDWIKANSDV